MAGGNNEAHKFVIPKTLHFIWYGPQPVPDISSWRNLHPGWEIRMWREGDISLENQRVYDYFLARKVYHGMADVARIEILLRYGGVYMDIDTECTRSLDEAPFMAESFWCVREPSIPGLVANGMIGATKGHPIIAECQRRIGLISTESGIVPWRHTGPMLLTDVLKGFNDTNVLPAYSFIPLTKSGKSVPQDGLNYGRHLWATTTTIQKAANMNSVFYLARECYKNGRYREAESFLNEYIEVTKLASEKGLAYFLLSKCLFQLSRGDEARAACLMAIQINPMHKEALQFMSELHFAPWKAKWARLASAADNSGVLFMADAKRNNSMLSFKENIPIILDAVYGLSPKKILDVGAGFGKYGLLIREQYLSEKAAKSELSPTDDIVIDAIEDTAYFLTDRLRAIYNMVFDKSVFCCGDVFAKGAYDIVLMIDVVEHWEKDATISLIREISKHSAILVSTPASVGMYTKHYYGDPRHHITQWAVNDFVGAFGNVTVIPCARSIIVIVPKQHID